MYCKFYQKEEDAFSAMKRYNQSLTKKTHKFLRVLVDGPEDNYAVVDLNTAIELGTGYQWSF